MEEESEDGDDEYSHAATNDNFLVFVEWNLCPGLIFFDQPATIDKGESNEQNHENNDDCK